MINSIPARLLLLCALLTPLLGSPSEEAAPAGFGLWTAKSVSPLLADMLAEAPSDPHQFAVRQLADYPNDALMLVHRAADGPVEWHETQVDVFFVKSGSATLVLGGKLLNGETVGPREKRNGSIEGGFRCKITAGDVVRIPARVPHQLLLEGSGPLDYFVVKVKGY